jgi:hypothetical protein
MIIFENASIAKQFSDRAQKLIHAEKSIFPGSQKPKWREIDYNNFPTRATKGFSTPAKNHFDSLVTRSGSRATR